jgi:hypothetical protein
MLETLWKYRWHVGWFLCWPLSHVTTCAVISAIFSVVKARLLEPQEISSYLISAFDAGVIG